MARAPKKASAEPKVAPPPPEAEAGVEPVVAVNKITYGAGLTALPGVIFNPVSKAERHELVEVLKAARELNEAEEVVYAQIAASAPAPTTGVADDEPKAPEGDSDKEPAGDAANADPIG